MSTHKDVIVDLGAAHIRLVAFDEGRWRTIVADTEPEDAVSTPNAVAHIGDVMLIGSKALSVQLAAPLSVVSGLSRVIQQQHDDAGRQAGWLGLQGLVAAPSDNEPTRLKNDDGAWVSPSASMQRVLAQLHAQALVQLSADALTAHVLCSNDMSKDARHATLALVGHAGFKKSVAIAAHEAWAWGLAQEGIDFSVLAQKSSRARRHKQLEPEHHERSWLIGVVSIGASTSEVALFEAPHTQLDKSSTADQKSNTGQASEANDARLADVPATQNPDDDDKTRHDTKLAAQKVFLAPRCCGTALALGVGGMDMDAQLALALHRAFYEQHGVDLVTQPVARARLRMAATAWRQRRHGAGGQASDAVILPFICAANTEMLSLEMRVTEDMLALAWGPTLDGISQTCHMALRHAQRDAKDVAAIIVVGGLAAMPEVQERVHKAFGVVPQLWAKQDLALKGAMAKLHDQILPHDPAVDTQDVAA